MEEKQKFIEWLQIKKKLSLKSSRDVFSRLKRASIINDVFSSDSEKDSLDKLINSSFFKELKSSVKSQMKRAVALYFEYKNQ